MTPEIATYSRYIREKIAQFDVAVSSLSEADLNRAPDFPGANSPFVIATHVLGNMRAWILGIVCGQELRRDRPAEFVSHGTYQQIRAAAFSLSSEIEAALEGLDANTLGDRFTPPQELWGEGTSVELQRREGFAHALEHAGIHLGHMHVTLELLKR